MRFVAGFLCGNVCRVEEDSVPGPETALIVTNNNNKKMGAWREPASKLVKLRNFSYVLYTPKSSKI